MPNRPMHSAKIAPRAGHALWEEDVAVDGALTRLCDTSDVGPDTPARAEVDGETYAVFEVDGEYFVTQDLCTHGPGYLSEGYVEDGEVECPFHQGRFDIRTGAPTLAPCTEAVCTWAVTIRDGGVWIDPRQARKSDIKLAD